jgi:hypothetical protein
MSNAPDTLANPAPYALFRLHVGLHSPDGRNDQATCKVRRALALDAIGRRFDAFTASDVQGYWKGQSEPTLILEVYAPDTGANRETARAVAETIREDLAQECVGLAILPARFLLV